MINFERSEKIAKKIQEARRLSPYRALSIDMTSDYSEGISGRNRRIDRRIAKFGDSIISLVASEMTPYSNRDISEGSARQLVIFDEVVEDEVCQKISDFANRNAALVSYSLRYAGVIKLGRDFQFKSALNDGTRISMQDFDRMWATSYAQRLGQAAVLQNAGIEMNRARRP